MNMHPPSSLRRAWTEYGQAESKYSPASVSESYANAFGRGYIASNAPINAEVPSSWQGIEVADWTFKFDPRLPVHVATSTDAVSQVVILGHAFDSNSGSRDSKATSSWLLGHLSETSSWSQFDHAVAWVGGRFAVFARKGDEWRVHVDPMASLSCYWAKSGSALTFSSHSALVANSVGDTASEAKNWIMTHPDYESPAGKSLPGLIHPFDSVQLLFANSALAISGSECTSNRFFPFEELPNIGLEQAASEFLEELRFQTDCWAQTQEVPFLALTAGQDSKAILSCTTDILESHGTIAMTYHFFQRATKSTFEDLTKANQLALNANLKFSAIDLSAQLRGGTEMAALYNKTFPSWARFPTLAQAFYENLPIDSTLMIGIGGGIGTAFYRKREDKVISPELLASKFTTAAVKNDPRLVATMASYIDLTDFREDHLQNYDFYDMFHWEHRLSKWGATGYSEYDLSTSSALPMNSRKLICAMLALPYEERKDKAIYKQLGRWSGIV